MKTSSLMKTIKEYLESEEIMNQFNLTMASLLKKEKFDLQKCETNWQSFVLSKLAKMSTDNGEASLLYEWTVKGLEKYTSEVYNFFCKNNDWVGKDKNWCMREGRCWEKEEARLDAVLKDKKGNWLAVFEYEDDFELLSGVM